MISFVYLDVGGVAILDFSNTEKWDELRAELGINPDNSVTYDAIWAEYYPRLCTTGNVEDLVPVFRRKLGLELPPGYSLLNAFVRRFEPNPSIWKVAEAIKRDTPVGLLTNMYIGMFDAILQADILPPVDWDVIIDSSLEGYQKPDVKLFEIAQQKAGVPAREILFVDNSAEHIETANSLGWQTFLYDTANPQQSSRELLAFFQKNFVA